MALHAYLGSCSRVLGRVVTRRGIIVVIIGGIVVVEDSCLPHPSSSSKVPKGMRFGGCRKKLTNVGPHIGNCEWCDLPKDVDDLVEKVLEVKKVVVEIELNGYHLVFDFLHLRKVNMKTGLQQTIPWIDDASDCFFLEVYTYFVEEPYNTNK
ncbi:hypothetical protein V8G54_015796 [Vigna mungo]|uniref:RCD1 WWE domain-containing protein n=1 Tax=Vigna mungo TaxID=3915 RepID=A0AAQ3S0H6_VIGMU